MVRESLAPGKASRWVAPRTKEKLRSIYVSGL